MASVADTWWVRRRSTSNETALSDLTIGMFIDDYADKVQAKRRNLALADCLEYLAQDDVYESYSRGGISVGKNRLLDRAAQLRAKVGATVNTGTLTVAGWEAETTVDA